jgi:hypothetical protein
MIDRVLRGASRPVDSSSLGAFRFLLGAVMAGGLCRYVLQGWIEVVFVEPTFFFKYPGFEWVSVPGPLGLHGLFGAALLGALGVALGTFHRISLAVFLAAFTYIQLMDATNYLNHYYLVILFGGLMVFMPLDRRHSLRTWHDPSAERRTMPVWMLYVLRFQVAVVYLHAAFAKAGPDWLWFGQPMNIWMAARSEMFLLGPILALPQVPWLMSWAGFLYDLTIVGWLSVRKTRPWAYGAVVVFHAFTFLLFDIGMFPFIMTVATTLFFEPDWPIRLKGRIVEVGRRWSGSTRLAEMLSSARWTGVGARSAQVDTSTRPAPTASPFVSSSGWSFAGSGSSHGSRLHPVAAVALLIWCGFQALYPLRSHLHGGDVLWHERGMRWSWKVMVREKNASITYRVEDRTTGREWQVSPRRYLDWRQANEMAGQPDLIRQLAFHVANDFRERGVPDVAVRVDAWASLNGRPPHRLIDPEVDLVSLSEAAVRSGTWIEPAPTGAPKAVRTRRLAELP